MSGLVGDVPYVTSSDPVTSYPITSEALARAVAARATKAEVSGAGMPVGAIVAYGGSVAPEGWHLCDGSEHGSDPLTAVIGSTTTPDLRARFIVGAGAGADGLASYAVGAKGGAESVLLSAAQSGLQAHSHEATSGNDTPDHRHAIDHDHPAVNTSSVDPPISMSFSSGKETGGELSGSGVQYLTDGAGGGSGGAALTADQGAHLHSADVPVFYGTSGLATARHAHPVTVSSNTAADATAAHENRPPYWALTYIIRKG